MIDLSIIVIGKIDVFFDDNIELLCTDGSNIIDIIKKSKGKYITFLSDKDFISENYLDKIKEKIKKDFFRYIGFVIKKNMI